MATSPATVADAMSSGSTGSAAAMYPAPSRTMSVTAGMAAINSDGVRWARAPDGVGAS
ncbi:MAG: hypothetical protein HXK03_03960 [Schaalia georgiae]|uniref:Uncharacterized protein n=1 Tax=Schaalia georgiae TaxID=52768 RepID=A0A929N0L1_9ACTO|nr:hypothetical protein [Schaalia georgiae]